jgi:hypothetical protein
VAVVVLTDQKRLPFVAVRPPDRWTARASGRASQAHPYIWLQILTQNRSP